jgi:Uncharacterised methyltransferase family (DUF6094)
MHIHGKTKLGFFPLPLSEAKRLKNHLTFPWQFSAIDPCVGDGVAFSALVEGTLARRYGVEIDAHRAAQARSIGIEVLQANTMDVRCNAESFSLLYLNPPYDWESGQTGNERLESIFLEHTYRWMKPEGILVFVIPQPRLKACARLLADHFKDIRVLQLTEAETAQKVIKQIREVRHLRLVRGLSDSPLLTKPLFGSAFKTEDSILNELLESARVKFLSDDQNLRKEALEKLWDAWERLKTLEPGKDKKDSIRILLDKSAPDPSFRETLEDEATQLTAIGNSYIIRHTEIGKTPITSPEQTNYLFYRMFSLKLSAAYTVGTFADFKSGNGLKRAPSSGLRQSAPVFGLNEFAG